MQQIIILHFKKTLAKNKKFLSIISSRIKDKKQKKMLLTSVANSINSIGSKTMTTKPIKRELGSFMLQAPPFPLDRIVLVSL